MFSQKIPGVVAPIAAPAILAVGVTGAGGNFVALHLVAAALAAIGGLIIAAKVHGVR
jgi:hypothetical protein